MYISCVFRCDFMPIIVRTFVTVSFHDYTLPCQPLLSAHLQHFCMGFLNSVLLNNTFNWSSTNGAISSVSLEFLSTCCTATHMTRTTVNNHCILGSLKTYYALRNRAIWRSWTAFMAVNLFWRRSDWISSDCKWDWPSSSWRTCETNHSLVTFLTFGASASPTA